MLFNELAQWAVLVFLAVFVVGLTRQLGNFMAGPRTRAASVVGPEVGDPLPAQLLTPDEKSAFRGLMEERGVDWGAVLVVDDSCVGCDKVVERIEQQGVPEGAPLVVFSRRSTSEHEARLSEFGDQVIVDPERVRMANLRSTPFVMVVDRSMKVCHKALATHLADAVETWRAPDAGNGHHTAGAGPALQVAQVGGES